MSLISHGTTNGVHKRAKCNYDVRSEGKKSQFCGFPVYKTQAKGGGVKNRDIRERHQSMARNKISFKGAAIALHLETNFCWKANLPKMKAESNVEAVLPSFLRRQHHLISAKIREMTP